MALYMHSNFVCKKREGFECCVHCDDGDDDDNGDVDMDDDAGDNDDGDDGDAGDMFYANGFGCQCVGEG